MPTPIDPLGDPPHASSSRRRPLKPTSQPDGPFTSERPMTITDLVAPEAILPALKVNNKKQELQELGARAKALTRQNEPTVFGVLLQREKLGTTAVGYGVAIPHGKLPKLERLFGLFARL